MAEVLRCGVGSVAVPAAPEARADSARGQLWTDETTHDG